MNNVEENNNIQTSSQAPAETVQPTATPANTGKYFRDGDEFVGTHIPECSAVCLLRLDEEEQIVGSLALSLRKRDLAGSDKLYEVSVAEARDAEAGESPDFVETPSKGDASTVSFVYDSVTFTNWEMATPGGCFALAIFRRDIIDRKAFVMELRPLTDEGILSTVGGDIIADHLGVMAASSPILDLATSMFGTANTQLLLVSAYFVGHNMAFKDASKVLTWKVDGIGPVTKQVLNDEKEWRTAPKARLVARRRAEQQHRPKASLPMGGQALAALNSVKIAPRVTPPAPRPKAAAPAVVDTYAPPAPMPAPEPVRTEVECLAPQNNGQSATEQLVAQLQNIDPMAIAGLLAGLLANRK